MIPDDQKRGFRRNESRAGFQDGPDDAGAAKPREGRINPRRNRDLLPVRSSVFFARWLAFLRCTPCYWNTPREVSVPTVEVEDAEMTRNNNAALALLTLVIASITIGCDGRERSTDPLGKEKTTKTEVLEAGAALLQKNAPLDAMDVYLVGFHPLKDGPHHQLEAHHICAQVNEDFAQCVLFDGNTAKANLTGIEYIISESLFDSLPEKEREFWHPHNYEILSGQLIAPMLPDVAELELMRGKMNSYGKTWHTWNTSGDDASAVPIGEPKLAWSFNRDGEARPGLIETRDKSMGVDAEETRRKRQELVPLSNPQEGVDVLKDAFENTRPTEGVRDKNAAQSP